LLPGWVGGLDLDEDCEEEEKGEERASALHADWVVSCED